MLDWTFERECDVVLAVTAPEAEQVARLTRARGWSESDARGRLDAQRTNGAFCAAADRVIENSGSLEALRAAALSELERLRAR